MAWSGGWTDRAGPRPVLLWGMAAFVVAQVVSGLAPTMAVFVVGRAASGAAEALIDTALMVLVAQALPEALRAKIFASFAAAWILPSLLGPSLAGAIDALWGWRLVFVAPLLVVPVALVLLRPALRRTHAGGASTSDAAATASERRRVAAALLLAAGLAVTTFSAPLLSEPDTRVVGALVIGGGAVLVVVGAVRALPHGMARLARGVPTVIAVRMLVSAAFTAVAGLIPLMLVQTHDASTAVAGVSLSVTGCLWARRLVAQQRQPGAGRRQRADPGRDRRGPHRRRVARAGAALARRHRAGARHAGLGRRRARHGHRVADAVDPAALPRPGVASRVG